MNREEMIREWCGPGGIDAAFADREAAAKVEDRLHDNFNLRERYVQELVKVVLETDGPGIPATLSGVAAVAAATASQRKTAFLRALSRPEQEALLKPCPFCGGKFIPTHPCMAGERPCASVPKLEELHGAGWRVSCYGCGVSTWNNLGYTKEQVIVAWNTRAGDEAAAEAIEKLAKLAENGKDPEADHIIADSVLCLLLAKLGHTAVVEAWCRVKKWYA